MRGLVIFLPLLGCTATQQSTGLDVYRVSCTPGGEQFRFPASVVIDPSPWMFGQWGFGIAYVECVPKRETGPGWHGTQIRYSSAASGASRLVSGSSRFASCPLTFASSDGVVIAHVTSHCMELQIIKPGSSDETPLWKLSCEGFSEINSIFILSDFMYIACRRDLQVGRQSCIVRVSLKMKKWNILWECKAADHESRIVRDSCLIDFALYCVIEISSLQGISYELFVVNLRTGGESFCGRIVEEMGGLEQEWPFHGDSPLPKALNWPRIAGDSSSLAFAWVSADREVSLRVYTIGERIWSKQRRVTSKHDERSPCLLTLSYLDGRCWMMTWVSIDDSRFGQVIAQCFSRDVVGPPSLVADAIRVPLWCGFRRSSCTYDDRVWVPWVEADGSGCQLRYSQLSATKMTLK